MWSSCSSCCLFFLFLGASPSSAFISGIIVSVLVQSVSVIELKKLTNINIVFYMNDVIKPLALMIVISVVPICIVKNSIVSDIMFLIVSLVYSLVILPYVSYIVCMNKQERLLVRSYVNKFLTRKK